MAMRLVRGFSAAAVLLFGGVSGEDSCPRGAGQCNGPSGDASSSKRSATAPVQATADLITQEVDELKEFVKLCDERIGYLQELKQMADGTGSELASLPESHARVLKEPLPLMSEVALDHETGPTGSADDYLFSKAVISQESPVSFINFLPLKAPRSGGSSSSNPSQSSMPSVLLAAAQVDGAVRLFSPTGELLSFFSAGHEFPVTNMAVSQSQDEYNIMTADAGGVIRVHKINVRQRRLTKDQKSARKNSTDEKVSQFLGAQVNVTAQFTKQMQVPPGSNGEQPKLTALAMASQSGTKYVVVGDEEGKIGFFLKNGSFAAKIDASATPGARVEAFYAHLSNLIFRTGHEWGFVDMVKHEVTRMDCPGFDGAATAIVIDSQQASRALISDADGTVWVFNVKEKKNCKFEHKFPKGATHAPMDLASIKGFTIALEQVEHNGDGASILALNMSHVGKTTSGNGAVVWRKGRGAVRDWSVNKRHQAGDLLAFLSQDGSEIEIMELLMQVVVYNAPSSSNDFGNFKLPLIGGAIILVLGYQYMKNKGKMGGGGGGGGKGKMDFNNMDFSSFKNKGMGGGAKKGLGGLAGLANKGRMGGLKR